MSDAPPSPDRPPLARTAEQAQDDRAASIEARMVDAWCEWLGAMATDAEAAMAAAMAYKALDDDARMRWLAALEEDVARLSVPPIAVYAPLLAVETNADRRAMILVSIGEPDERVSPRSRPKALWGFSREGVRVAVVVHPLYLDFAQVLACGYRPTEGFEWVRHDPIVGVRDAPDVGSEIEGVIVESTPLKALVDDLALTVLAHTRQGRRLPEALRLFADLFGPGEGSPPPVTLP